MGRHVSFRRGRSRGISASASYLIAAAVYACLLYLVNVRPGWEALPFVTDHAQGVVWLLNLVLAASLAANLIYALDDATRIRALGAYLIALVTLALVMQLLEVFPFDFGVDQAGWESAWRVTLQVIGVLVLVRAVKAAVRIVRGGRVSAVASRRAY